MARDLFQEVESLLSTANPYIQRKAALCTMRIIRKVPDLQEHFLNKTKPLLQDRKNHGVLLCGLTLVTDLCLHDPELIPHYTPYAPVLVQHLKKLTSSGYAPEHDVTGITDPFLQVKILRLLRILGKNNPDVSEQINDILTQVWNAAVAGFWASIDWCHRLLRTQILPRTLAIRSFMKPYSRFSILKQTAAVQLLVSIFWVNF